MGGALPRRVLRAAAAFAAATKFARRGNACWDSSLKTNRTRIRPAPPTEIVQAARFAPKKIRTRPAPASPTCPASKTATVSRACIAAPTEFAVSRLQGANHFTQTLRQLCILAVIHGAIDQNYRLIQNGLFQNGNQFFRGHYLVTLGAETLRQFYEIRV